MEYVREAWDETGAGIWEVRGGERHFVYSKVTSGERSRPVRRRWEFDSANR